MRKLRNARKACSSYAVTKITPGEFSFGKALRTSKPSIPECSFPKLNNYSLIVNGRLRKATPFFSHVVLSRNIPIKLVTQRLQVLTLNAWPKAIHEVGDL